MKRARPKIGPRTLVVGVLAAGVVLAAVVLVNQMTRPLPAADSSLATLPELAEPFPGATLLGSGDRPVSTTVDGTFPAASWRQYSVASGDAEVLDYFRALLARRGWATGGGVSTNGSIEERTVCGWHRDDLTFRVAIWDPVRYASTFHTEPMGDTIFEVRVIGDRSDEFNRSACWHSPLSD